MINFYKIYDLGLNLYSRLSIILSRFVILPPVMVRVFLSDRCNLNCWFCFLKGDLNQKQSPLLTKAEWAEIIRPLPRWTLLDVTGGEPTTHPQFFEIMDMFLKKHWMVSLCTNGKLLKPNHLEFFVKNSLRQIAMSLDGFEATHDSIRGPGGYQKVVEIVKTIKHLRYKYNTKFPIISLKLVITEDSLETLDAVIEHVAHEINPDNFKLTLQHDCTTRGNNFLRPSLKDEAFERGNSFTYSAKGLNHLKFLLKKYGRGKVINGTRIAFGPFSDPIRLLKYAATPKFYRIKKCLLPAAFIGIRADGEVVVCDTPAKVINIRQHKMDLLSVMKGHQYQHIRDRLISPPKEFRGCDACCVGNPIGLTSQDIEGPADDQL